MSDARPTSGWAITSLVLSCLFCVPLAPLAGMIVAIVALVKIGSSNGKLGGQALAIAALALGVMTLIANIGVVAAIAVPNFIRYQLRSKTAEARVNLRGIQISMESFYKTENKYPTIAPNSGDLDMVKMTWDDAPCPKECTRDNIEACTTFDCVGFKPAGDVYYRYACNAVNTESSQDYTCAAVGDLDGDGNAGVYVVGSNNAGGLTIVVPLPDIVPVGSCAPDSTPAFAVTECTVGQF